MSYNQSIQNPDVAGNEPLTHILIKDIEILNSEHYSLCNEIENKLHHILKFQETENASPNKSGGAGMDPNGAPLDFISVLRTHINRMSATKSSLNDILKHLNKII